MSLSKPTVGQMAAAMEHMHQNQQELIGELTKVKKEQEDAKASWGKQDWDKFWAPKGRKQSSIVDTGATKEYSKEFLEEHFLAPIGRNATPEEMGDPLIFLNSHAARFISGHNLLVDYGYVASTEIGQRQALL